MEDKLRKEGIDVIVSKFVFFIILFVQEELITILWCIVAVVSCDMYDVLNGSKFQIHVFLVQCFFGNLKAFLGCQCLSTWCLALTSEQGEFSDELKG